MKSRFASFDHLQEAWYAVATARGLKAERPQRVDFPGLPVVLYRGKDGIPRALSARCPHLGADLSQGTVTEQGLRCAFHHWTFGDAGVCVRAPGHAQAPDRCARSFPVQEAHGLLWVWLGKTPTYDLPPAPPGRWRRLVLPGQELRCHPSLIVGNGLDQTHFTALHGMRMLEPPVVADAGEHGVALSMCGRPENRFLSWFTGAGDRTPLRAAFRATGPSIATLEVRSPIPFHVVFSARPTAAKTARTRVALYLPRNPFAAARCLVLMLGILHDDRRVLEALDFHPSFADGDEALRRYAAAIERMEVVRP